MPRYSTEKHKAKKGARFQFELLEPRHLFSVNPLESPSSDAPPLELTSTAPQLEQQADQALTNFTWLPMVFAGADKIASVSSSLLLTGDVIVNATANLSVAWSKISGPGNAIFGNSSSVSSSVLFDQAGTYELQLAATNGGLTSIDRVFVTVTASNTINIDQAWLDNPANQGTVNGRTVYILKQAGKTFALQTDVSTKGTAFYIANKDITLDLNGHKVTYNTDNLAGPASQEEHRLGTHGVVLYTSWHNTEISSISGSASPKNSVIKNGDIENANAGNLAHGIWGLESQGALIENLRITTNGKDSSTIAFTWSNGGVPTISDCVLTTNTSTTFNRHQGPANVKVNGATQATGNILIGGNCGFNIGSNSVISNNIIAHNGFVTNGYGVFAFKTANVTVSNNLILPTNGRGIIFDQGTNNIATGNVILHLESPNAEFGEALDPPAIRLRYNASGNTYLNNTSLGIGGGGYTSASSIYLSNTGIGGSTFENNTATTILIGSPDAKHYAQPVTFEGQGTVSSSVGPGLDKIQNNTFKSNHNMIGLAGYDGAGQQLEPLKGNSWAWTTGSNAYSEFSAAVNAKLLTFSLSADVKEAAQSHISQIGTLVEQLVGNQGLQSSRKFWNINGWTAGKDVFADILDSTFGSEVDPKAHNGISTNDSKYLIRDGFTRKVQFVDGGAPLADKAITVTTPQGDSYSATTDGEGFATLTFFNFGLEKAAGGSTQPYAIVERSQTTIAINGKSFVIAHRNVPAKVDLSAASASMTETVDQQAMAASHLWQFTDRISAFLPSTTTSQLPNSLPPAEPIAETLSALDDALAHGASAISTFLPTSITGITRLRVAQDEESELYGIEEAFRCFESLRTWTSSERFSIASDAKLANWRRWS